MTSLFCESPHVSRLAFPMEIHLSRPTQGLKVSFREDCTVTSKFCARYAFLISGLYIPLMNAEPSNDSMTTTTTYDAKFDIITVTHDSANERDPSTHNIRTDNLFTGADSSRMVSNCMPSHYFPNRLPHDLDHNIDDRPFSPRHATSHPNKVTRIDLQIQPRRSRSSNNTIDSNIYSVILDSTWQAAVKVRADSVAAELFPGG